MKRRKQNSDNKYSYDPLTGVITYKTSSGNMKAGKIAGHTRDDGYIIIGQVYAHVLAWRIYYGKWPPDNMEVDHLNRIRSDNRIENLVLKTRILNRHNRDDADQYGRYVWHKNDKYRNKRYTVRINGISLGYFETNDMAIYARDMYLQSKEIEL